MTPEHKPVPREGETFYRHGVPVRQPPRPADHPLMTICLCGRTIERVSADQSWAHKVWA